MHPRSFSSAFSFFNLAKIESSRLWLGLLNKCFKLPPPTDSLPKGSKPLCGPWSGIGFGCDPLSWLAALRAAELVWISLLLIEPILGGWPSASGLDQLSTA